MTKLITAAIAVLALSAAAAPPAGIPRGDAAHSPTHDVLGWTVSDDRTVYVEDRSGQWYRVDLVAACDGLRTAFGLELQGNPLFDQSSSIFTGDRSCPIASVSRVSEPAIPPLEPLAPTAGPSGR
ncbi:MAG: hypothetical protein QOD42_2348 [Sphingomonadales bacterium]|jgi:hypothetical protein|nr:hypothetical protein [Sphingomonadales bacterium]